MQIRHPMQVQHRVTSRFGPRRHPVTGQIDSHHNGVDLVRAANTANNLEIVAIADGTVTRVVSHLPNTHSGNVTTNTAGNRVDYTIADGTLVKNMHLAANSVTVRVGDRIRAGQVIGIMGRTGRVTGVHLHFEMRRNNIPFDPLPLVEAAHFNPMEEEFAVENQLFLINGEEIALPAINRDGRTFTEARVLLNACGISVRWQRPHVVIDVLKPPSEEAS